MITGIFAEMSSSSIVGMVIWIVLLGILMFLNTALNPLSEKWKQYEGSIITGIKLAEKNISDDTNNKGLAKLDYALKFVLDAYAEVNKGKKPSGKIVDVIRQGIQIKHSKLEASGVLKSTSNA